MKHSTLPSGPNSGNTHVVGSLSRPIKFRAWGRYGEWEEDENLDCRKWQMIDGDSLCFEEFKPICDLLKTENDVEYFMQFTGLYDKNGNDTYIAQNPELPLGKVRQNLIPAVLWGGAVNVFR